MAKYALFIVYGSRKILMESSNYDRKKIDNFFILKDKQMSTVTIKLTPTPKAAALEVFHSNTYIYIHTLLSNTDITRSIT